jgi:alkylation response protein AidB-like acyl-CoA dehydrogenase
MSDMTAEQVLNQARRIADEVLFPSALIVDSADRVPAAHFDCLAAARLYGLAGPVSAGGLDADLATFCGVTEIMAGGCLATAFVWLQHHAAVRALAASANQALAAECLEPLCLGTRRAGVALGGARPGAPLLRARPVPGGWTFDGTAPWVTGWDMIDVVYTLARDESGTLIAALLPAVTSASLSAEQLDLVAVNASRTVELSFDAHFVPSGLVTGTVPLADWLAGDAGGLRPNGSLALGVAARCCRLISEAAGAAESGGAGAAASGVAGAAPGDLAAQLAAARAALDAADAATLPNARAAAAELAFRASGALVTAAGSRSILAGQHPQRLAREALFLLVFGSRPAIRDQLTRLLTARGAGN